MGGAIGTFTELYAKVVLIFVLMVNTLTSPKRLEQFTWLLVSPAATSPRGPCSTTRAASIARGRPGAGAVGGMFGNPNDLALNMVTVMPMAAVPMPRPSSTIRRGVAAMSRSACSVRSSRRSRGPGAVGLAAMASCSERSPWGASPASCSHRVRGGAGDAVLAVVVLVANRQHRTTRRSLQPAPARRDRSSCRRGSMPSSTIRSPASVLDSSRTTTPAGRQERWKETHNALIQVAAETGLLRTTVVLIPDRARRHGGDGHAPHAESAPAGAPARPLATGLTENERRVLHAHSVGTTVALVGWFACSMFASVAYGWTFYYLLALDRRRASLTRGSRLAARPARFTRRRHARGGRGARMTASLRSMVKSMRDLNQRLSRRGNRRRILVDGHTPVNFTMVEPVYRACAIRHWPLRLHGQPRSRQARFRLPEGDRRHHGIPPAPGRVLEVRCVSDVRLPVGAAPARRRKSRCFTASAASTASTRRPVDA